MKQEISEKSHYVLGSVFARTKTLMFHNINNVPSPEMQQILDELVSVGLLKKEQGLDDMPAHGNAIRYRVEDDVDIPYFRQEASLIYERGNAPKIRMFVEKDQNNGKK